MRTAAGATMGYPAGWRAEHGDPGSATVASTGPREEIVGYLNLTPRQGEETLGNWASFRLEHNQEEGDRQVARLDAAGSLRFRTGRGSCVRDRYVTRVGARYIEIACLVRGLRTSVVAVAAAPPGLWSATAPLLERALSSLTA